MAWQATALIDSPTSDPHTSSMVRFSRSHEFLSIAIDNIRDAIMLELSDQVEIPNTVTITIENKCSIRVLTTQDVTDWNKS
jgi:hypothetical protein